MISLTLLPIVLALISFVATSTWALFGSAIKSHLHNPRLRMVVNVILSLLLVYSAISLIVFK
jgi:cysteine/O-acetylserine efflux protein